FSYFFIFFYCYVHRRDLPSFPTRRSSDLREIDAKRDERGIRLRVVGRVADHRGVRDERIVDRQAVEAAVDSDGDVLVDQVSIDEDRKSTRLNSSHLGISYAVFCLKKKKKV